MNPKLKVIAIAAFLTMGTAATAQTENTSPAKGFANEWNKRALRETHNTYLTGTPVMREKADAPLGKQSFADGFATMQAQSSADESSGVRAAYAERSAVAADPANRESFAQRFAEMQAASSNSGEFSVTAGAKAMSGEPGGTRVAGGFRNPFKLSR